MKKIFMFGDSIRLGYDLFVRLAYEGQAQVFFPDENCRFASFSLRHVGDWALQCGCDEDVDCVHWNAGLWDCLTLFGEEPFSPLPIYEYYMDRLCRRIVQLFPKAKVIFATSTPVIETPTPTPGASYRRNEDICRYNEAAVRIAQKYGFAVNDLYATAKEFPDSYHSDGTHFYTRKGAEAIAAQVLRAMDNCMGLTAKTPDYDTVYGQTSCFENGMDWLNRRAEILNAAVTRLGE